MTNTFDTKIILHNYISLLGRAELCWNFSSWLRDAPDIYRFPVEHMFKIHFLLENLQISGTSLGSLEKFQHSLALPNTKCNCVILFLCQMYWSFLYCFKIFYLIDHHCKTPQIRQKLLKFLQGVKWGSCFWGRFEMNERHLKGLFTLSDYATVTVTLKGGAFDLQRCWPSTLR